MITHSGHVLVWQRRCRSILPVGKGLCRFKLVTLSTGFPLAAVQAESNANNCRASPGPRATVSPVCPFSFSPSACPWRARGGSAGSATRMCPGTQLFGGSPWLPGFTNWSYGDKSLALCHRCREWLGPQSWSPVFSVSASKPSRERWSIIDLSWCSSSGSSLKSWYGWIFSWSSMSWHAASLLVLGHLSGFRWSEEPKGAGGQKRTLRTLGRGPL